MEVILPDDMFAEPNGRIPNLVYAVCKLCALVFVGSMCVLSLVGPIIGLLQLRGCGLFVGRVGASIWRGRGKHAAGT